MKYRLFGHGYDTHDVPIKPIKKWFAHIGFNNGTRYFFIPTVVLYCGNWSRTLEFYFLNFYIALGSWRKGRYSADGII